MAVAAKAFGTKASGRPKKTGNTTRKPAAVPKDTSPSEATEKIKPALRKPPTKLISVYQWINDRRFYIPLVLAVSLQSFTISVWVYFEFIRDLMVIQPIVLTIAIMAGLSLESVMIGTVFSTTEKTKITAYVTLFAAWLGSTWIALALFNTGAFIIDNWVAWDLKHAIWPTVISLYLLHRSNVQKHS